VAAALLIVLSLAIGCGPNLPPTIVPPQPSPAFTPFAAALKAYVNQTPPYRKQAAQTAEQLPDKAAPSAGAEAAVRLRQTDLADALKAQLRPGAKQGDLFSSDVASAIRHDVDEWLDGVFADAADKWRICFFHHPLYSSGQHAGESRDVIRPALEPALTR
jgi:hypothetical protein